jgi:hypothetical protein
MEVESYKAAMAARAAEVSRAEVDFGINCPAANASLVFDVMPWIKLYTEASFVFDQKKVMQQVSEGVTVEVLRNVFSRLQQWNSQPGVGGASKTALKNFEDNLREAMDLLS